MNIVEQLLPNRAGANNHSREGMKPKLIVCHIQDGYGNPFNWFKSVNADCTIWISRDDKPAVRYLYDTDMPWTNGSWDAPDLSNPVIKDLYRRGIDSNQVSLTIEHEGKGGESMTNAQLEKSAQVIAYWCNKFNIPCTRDYIVGHYQVGPHKYCPGVHFQFDALIERAKEILTTEYSMPTGLPPEGGNTQTNEHARYFPETDFWVVDYVADMNINFLQYWNRVGLGQLGYPITGAYYSDEYGCVIQWFERARLEYHPENSTEYKVLEGLTGKELLELKKTLEK